MSYAFCHRILQGLWAAGVRDMVVTPGSRSTPLLIAALTSEMKLHRAIDERSAAFFALGRARARESKVALLCTSGSAGAHYLPALLEARYAGHVLIALTADRPPEFRDTGANQTIDQRQLFAAACPPCLELAVPDGTDANALAAGHRVHETVALARGPIHINLAFQKPLEPQPGSAIPEPAVFPATAGSTDQLLRETTEQLANKIQSAERGIVICGPSFHKRMGPAVSNLASRLGFALLAESTSGARFTGSPHPQRIDYFHHILENELWRQELAPEIILQFGADPACGPLLRWLSGVSAPRIRFGDDRVLRAPANTVEVISGNSLKHCEALASCGIPAADRTYVEAWKTADERCWTHVQEHLGSDGKELSEAVAIDTIFRELAEDTQLTIGNSLPIRGVDAVVPGHRARLRILHQRGTSGIEGLIAGALGSSAKTPSALLMGDVSCAHDLSSLAMHREALGPLLIIVVDNGGGKIFSHLPVAAIGMPAKHWAFWESPPQVDFSLVCRGYGVAHRLCESQASLADSLRWAQRQDGTTMLQVKVAPDSMRVFLSSSRDTLA